MVGSLSSPSVYVPTAAISNHVLDHAISRNSPARAVMAGLLELIVTRGPT